MNIKEIIRTIINDPVLRKDIRLATVLSVSGSTCNVTALDTDAEIDDVRLQVEESDGILMTPAVGSTVAIAPIADFEFIVVMYSELQTIAFLDGSFGGLVKVGVLTEKVNNLENKVNDLITYINTHVHAGNGVPPAPLFLGAPLTPTIQAEIENDKITHGTV
jgi:hypothetical protein